MIISVLIASAVIGLMLVVLVQGQWTSLDSWFMAVLASVRHGYGDRPLRGSDVLTRPWVIGCQLQ